MTCNDRRAPQVRARVYILNCSRNTYVYIYIYIYIHTYIYVYICICMHMIIVHIHIYIYIERERDTSLNKDFSSLSHPSAFSKHIVVHRRTKHVGPIVYILQRGVQWKQGVVICVVLYTILLHNTTPIHCTPLPLHPPLQSIHIGWDTILTSLLSHVRFGVQSSF